MRSDGSPDTRAVTRTFLVAVVGPDGAGKSTLCGGLRERGVVVVYGGRGSGSTWYMKVVNAIRGKLSTSAVPLLLPVFMWSLFYPVEALAWRSRLKSLKSAACNVLVLERCMLDRLALLLKMGRSERMGRNRILSVLGRLYFGGYWSLVKELDLVLIVTAAPEDLVSRRPSAYRSAQDAAAWRDAYCDLGERLARESKVRVLTAETFEVDTTYHLIRQLADVR